MDLINKIGSFCIDNKESIAVAESVTAGCLQNMISHGLSAEKFFQGGITVYNTAQKTRHLNIEPICAQACNAVDAGIAVNMAIEVCNLFCSSIGMASTGYVAPYPERDVSTPFAYLALVYKGEVIHCGRVTARSKNYGLEVQQEYAQTMLEILAEKIETIRTQK